MASRAEWLAAAPFTLQLSAGFFGFFAHAGVLLALESRRLIPSRVVGVSAGAITGGLFAAGLLPRQIADRLGRLERREFWDPGLPLGGLLRGQRFAELLRRELEPRSVRSIESTAVPFAAVAFDVGRRQAAVLTQGDLVDAIRASSALPFLFRPVRIGGRLHLDGGITDRAGDSSVGPDERILLHHLVSTSPWSRRYARRSYLPEARPTRLTLVIEDLPRLTPFRLQQGVEAIAKAEASTCHWLEGPASAEAGA